MMLCAFLNACDSMLKEVAREFQFVIGNSEIRKSGLRRTIVLKIETARRIQFEFNIAYGSFKFTAHLVFKINKNRRQR
jgi:RNase adaptor protein for sRNA GlmZ degradation